MINGKRVLIIMPAWNEAGSIADVDPEVRGELPDVDVLVVDDGSTDDTAAKAGSAGATVARLPFNLGVGGAMRIGYRYAFDHGYDVAIQLDADGQHDPRYVPKLVDALDEADLVIGARFAGEGDYTVRGPRRWAMQMLSFVISRVAKTKLTDTTSGFRACNRRADRALRPLVPGGVPGRHRRGPGPRRPYRAPHQPDPDRDAGADGRHAQPIRGQGDALPRPRRSRFVAGPYPCLRWFRRRLARSHER